MEKEELQSLLESTSIKLVKKHNINFMLGDNMELLRFMHDNMMYKHFHYAIVDPPYAIEVGKMNLGATKDSKPRDYEMGDWDSDVPTQEYWDLLNYVSRNILVWGGNYFTKEMGKVSKDPYNRTSENIVGLESGRAFYVWDKLNNGMSFADCELCLTTLDGNARIIKKSRALKGDEGDKRHPTHKPAYLYEYLHNAHSMRGCRVLDTHGGSHSHAIAAFQSNVNLTIIERQESYHNDGIEAFVSHTSTTPQKLF